MPLSPPARSLALIVALLAVASLVAPESRKMKAPARR